MKKVIIYSIFLAIVLLTEGCGNAYKQEVLKEELREDLNSSENTALKKPPIEVIEVDAENFIIIKENIPDTETIKSAKIFGAQLHDVIALLTEATDQNVIFQLQSNTMHTGVANNNGVATAANNDAEVRQSNVYVSASQIDFGKLLKKAVGDKMSIRYEGDTYYLGYTRTVTVKIPSLKGLADILKTSLSTLGAMNVAHDSITSSVSFSAREKEYVDIMNYLQLLRNNLYVVEYDISIYNVDLKDNYSLGINWDVMSKTVTDLGFVATTTAAASLGATSAPSATFGAIMNNNNYSANMMVDLLSQFGKVESIQRPKLLGVAGTDVVLVDGLEEPYIKQLATTAVGDNAVQTSTVSGTALSGLRVTLNSNIMDGTVLTDINLDINDIVGYSDFEVDKIKYSQPRTLTKNIRNSMRVQPGVPIVISGLFRNKTDKGYKGIPGVASTSARLIGGSEYEGTSKSEMVIIVTPRVIKYVVK